MVGDGRAQQRSSQTDAISGGSNVAADKAVDGGAAALKRTASQQELEMVARSLAQPEFETAEEALEASGFLADRPPQQHGETGHGFYTVQPMQLLSLYPRSYLMPKFLSRQQCQHVIDMALKRLAPSGLAFKAGDDAASMRDIRTSSGVFMARGEDPGGVLAYIEDKLAAVTMIPVGHGEPFNVLRYNLGQRYESHFDTFAEQYYGPQSSQRIATILLYLTDVEQGGETVFLLEGEDGLERLAHINYKACNTGIRIKPRAGDALLFFNTFVNGSINKHALHGGCPVVSGTKWVMTKWLRSNCFGLGC